MNYNPTDGCPEELAAIRCLIEWTFGAPKEALQRSGKRLVEIERVIMETNDNGRGKNRAEEVKMQYTLPLEQAWVDCKKDS